MRMRSRCVQLKDETPKTSPILKEPAYGNDSAEQDSSNVPYPDTAYVWRKKGEAYNTVPTVKHVVEVLCCGGGSVCLELGISSRWKESQRKKDKVKSLKESLKQSVANLV